MTLLFGHFSHQDTPVSHFPPICGSIAYRVAEPHIELCLSEQMEIFNISFSCEGNELTTCHGIVSVIEEKRI